MSSLAAVHKARSVVQCLCAEGGLFHLQCPCHSNPARVNLKNNQLRSWKLRRLFKERNHHGLQLVFVKMPAPLKQPAHMDLTSLQCPGPPPDGTCDPGSLHCKTVLSLSVCAMWEKFDGEIKEKWFFLCVCQHQKRLIRIELKVTSRIQSARDLTVEFNDTYKGRCVGTIICSTKAINHNAMCQCQSPVDNKSQVLLITAALSFTCTLSDGANWEHIQLVVLRDVPVRSHIPASIPR